MYWNPNVSDDEEDEEVITFGGRDGIIFLVDCNQSMFDEHESKPANFRSTLHCVESVMMNKIITSEKDLIGVVFYNTENSPNPKNETDLEPGLAVPKNTAIFMPMSPTSADSISYIKNIQESDDLFDFSGKYGHSSNCNFADALWLCSRMFNRCGYKLQTSRIVIFTDNDQPHPPGSHELQQTFIRAKDLNQLDVNITLVPMSDQFDGSLFYKEFLCTVMDDDLETIEIPSSKCQQEILIRRIYRRDFRKRCNYHLKFILGDGIEFGVGVYSLSRKTKYPKILNLQKDTHEPIISKKSYIQQARHETDNDTEIVDKRLLPSDQRKVQEIGGEKIVFLASELAAMKSLLSSGIKLLGFKPRSILSIHNFLKTGLFLYPDETKITGSTTLFRALWKKCLDKEKVAICVLTLRRKSHPAYVALVPQENEDNNDFQIRYNGFRVVFLPYQDDIRDPDIFGRGIPEISQENVDVFQKIIKKIKFKYEPQQFEDPVLHTLYSNIEAIVFKTEGREIEDTTLPDIVHQDSKIEPLIDQITEMFGTDVAVTGTKRSQAGTSGQRSKIQKTDNNDVNADEILSALRNGTIDKITVSTLRSYLQQVGVKGISSAKKSDLIDKIKLHHNL